MKVNAEPYISARAVQRDTPQAHEQPRVDAENPMSMPRAAPTAAEPTKAAATCAALGGPGIYAWLPDLAWALLPLLGEFTIRKWVVLAAAAALAVVAASPYYMGIVLIFGLGLTVPSLLPLAVFTAPSSKSRYSPFPLLVGPQVQLSVHYLVLARGWDMLYVGNSSGELYVVEGGKARELDLAAEVPRADSGINYGGAVLRGGRLYKPDGSLFGEFNLVLIPYGLVGGVYEALDTPLWSWATRRK